MTKMSLRLPVRKLTFLRRWAACFVLVGCRTPATQVQLFVDTDAPLERPLTVEVFSFNGSVAPSELATRANGVLMGTLRLARTNGAMGTFTAGGSIGVLAPSDRSQNTATLWVRATVAATATSPAILVDRAARVSFVRGRSGTARIFLPLRCGDQSVGCNSVAPDACTVSVRCREQNATCGDLGECVPAEVPVVIAGNDGAVEDAPTAAIDATSGRTDAALDVVESSDGSDGSDVVPIGSDASVPNGAFPQPIAPLSLGDVTLRRPTLRWQLPAETDGALVELCRDRACTARIETLIARGTSTRPTMALPPRSVVYWRLRAMAGVALGTTYSPTWLFHVPAVDNSGGVDSSANPHTDLNGDGFDDLVVGVVGADPGGRINAGAVRVQYGSMTGIASTPDRVIEGTATEDHLGFSMSSAGDVNGDGFGDLVVGANFASRSGLMNNGIACVFHGSPGGIAAAPTVILEGANEGDYSGYSVSSAGDTNGDGYGDLIVGAAPASPGGLRGAGSASLYLGSRAGVPRAPSRVFEGPAPNEFFGNAVGGGADVNGDGLSDFFIAAHRALDAGQPVGTVSIYHGRLLGPAMMADRVLSGTLANGLFGNSVANAGDLNNDGYSDLVVSAVQASPGGRVGAGLVAVYLGSIAGIAGVSSRILEGAMTNDRFGSSVAGAGDLNGDGFGDLLVGANGAQPTGRFNAGSVSVFRGSVDGISMVAERVISGLVAGDQLGSAVVGAGDLNGDGFADFALGGSQAVRRGQVLTGIASVFHGGANGGSAMPVVGLEGDFAGDQLGSSLAQLEQQSRRRPSWLARWESPNRWLHHRAMARLRAY